VKGRLPWTVDYPALYSELIEPANIVHLGPGGAVGLRLVLQGLKTIALRAIEIDDDEILEVLWRLGIIEREE